MVKPENSEKMAQLAMLLGEGPRCFRGEAGAAAEFLTIYLVQGSEGSANHWKKQVSKVGKRGV